MVYSSYHKLRILCYYYEGHRPYTIHKLLQREMMKASRRGIEKFIAKYMETGTINRRGGSSRPTVLTTEVMTHVEEQMRKDDETTAIQLYRLLQERGYSISLRTILRCRTILGWTFRGSAYCHMVRDANKIKRVEFARMMLNEDENFDNVVFTDECSIQLTSHRRFCCRKQGERPKLKPR